MDSNKFTEEQIAELSENSFTEYVSESTLKFTEEFKGIFIAALNSGKSVRKIFSDAGYDTAILGKSRMKSFAHRVNKELKAKGEYSSRIGKTKKCTKSIDYTAMTQKEAIARMQHEIQYLHQELEFIKKIIELDRQGERKI